MKTEQERKKKEIKILEVTESRHSAKKECEYVYQSHTHQHTQSY